MNIFSRIKSAIGLEERSTLGVNGWPVPLSATSVTPDTAQGVGACYAAVALIAEAIGSLPLKLYPALINAVLLVVFAASLAFPPTAVERIARLSEPDLPPSGVAYTRRVTQVWCGFFVLNGALALATALWMSDRAWALYNGLIAYGLIGLLFGVEWLVRQRVRAGHRHG